MPGVMAMCLIVSHRSALIWSQFLTIISWFVAVAGLRMWVILNAVLPLLNSADYYLIML